MQPGSVTDSGFIPRREFIRDQRATNIFGLLAISGSSCIRLYSFPPDVIAALRRLLDHFYLTGGFREDTQQNLCEFTITQKPWNAPKSPRTERILLDIFAVIYRFGYTILSTVDYGRERDDRLAISFSRLLVPSSPAPPFAPAPAGSGSNLSHQTGAQIERRMPFAISFVSQTIMRVINPPLNATPAILQAVRGSWPRGVLSEKKTDNAYEFKLKGYSWFNEDTFATDSLRHILSLLSSLDTHACSLVISLALNGRSRVKDLWVFTGPGTTETDPYWPESPISQSGSMLDVRRSHRVSTPEPPEAGMIPSSLHRRAATGPQHLPPYSLPPSQLSPHHVRSATESIVLPPLATNLPPRAVPGNQMRKPAPRAQVPVSVDFDAQDDDEHGRFRTSLASAVPSSCENMTGIGSMARNRFTSNHIYTATPGPLPESDHPNEDDVHSSPPPERHHRRPRSRSPSPQRRVSALRPVSTRSKTPPLLRSHSPPRDPRAPSLPPASHDISMNESPPLLSPGMFRMRDSAYSVNTVDTADTSSGVPFKWPGLGRPDGIENIEEVYEEPSEEPTPRLPVLPGAWALSPDEERPMVLPRMTEASMPDERGLHLERRRSPDKSLHDIDARIALPELVSDQAVRKSEAGLIGMISPPRQPPPPIHPPSRDSLYKRKASSSTDPPASPTKPGSRSGSGNGWVLVNVEGKEHMTASMSTPVGSPTSPTHVERGGKRTTSAAAERASMSAAAKAIAVIDAQDTKAKEKRQSTSGLRRLLSISRPGAKGADEVKSDPRLAAVRSKELASSEKESSKLTSPRQRRFRNKFTRLGASEPAARPPDRVRVNLD
ncbi:hypothetical protein DEU56DRAFT_757991 [Suillus clintonianus]|uniref:uncharacterized protein n=1 Tax=Suillus clintonianus TaxID=1904413 RepID=UPI001B865C94|nr:uncharacterized protein DEU56DRAFT_757991 [Suillus clintonianus]KAG2129935.1 hypothetical protein DEU56DRAFT_757991 [Suillus clintonianus]